MAQRLQNRTALVTGSTSNIDRAIAVAFAAEGAHVVVSGREEATRRLGGRLDILVNNAGIFPPNTTLTTDDRTFDQVYAVNVKAPFFLTQAVAPAMVAAGEGVIINLGSWVARLGLPVGSLYSSTKGALETLTRAWAAEFGPLGVRVNAVSPGVIRTLTWTPPSSIRPRP
ncbi:short-chain dehydrogenase/reductase SDR [Parafrankia sp. EAN1pec]|nr:short-chain dehydrogenase/reductase SDR [Frankia sp. EAN1pec]